MCGCSVPKISHFATSRSSCVLAGETGSVPAVGDRYKARAREVFAIRLSAMLEQALWVSDSPPLRILTMQTQWGSCSPNGRVTLNPNLVKAPRECIDYVILHELCHLAEHNHSERFYRLMGQVMPDWEKTKKRLDGMAGMIMTS